MQGGDIGSLVGSSLTSGKALHSFWTSSVNYSACGSGSLDKDEYTRQVYLNISVVKDLRSYSRMMSWNKWVLNANNASVTFKVGGGKGFAIKSQIIVLPDLVDSNEQTFFGCIKTKLTQRRSQRLMWNPIYCCTGRSVSLCTL